VACRRLGMDPAAALTYACAAGARNVTRRGPMEGAGTRDELDHFIAETERRAQCG
jgi:tagatose kinase